jgi:hypothetical protein
VTPPKEVLVSERIWRLWRLRFWYRTAAVVDLPVGDRNDLCLHRLLRDPALGISTARHNLRDELLIAKPPHWNTPFWHPSSNHEFFARKPLISHGATPFTFRPKGKTLRLLLLSEGKERDPGKAVKNPSLFAPFSRKAGLDGRTSGSTPLPKSANLE